MLRALGVKQLRRCRRTAAIPTGKTNRSGARRQRLVRERGLIGSERAATGERGAAASDGGTDSCSTGLSDAVAAGGAGRRWPDNQPTNRYPRRGTVSTNRGRSAESSSASRSFRTALFNPTSKSTNVSAVHSTGEARRA